MSEAIILAAGVGSRLASVHGGRPKCLVPVGGRSILEWQLRALADAAVEHIVIVTGYKGELVREAAESLGLPFEFTFMENSEYRTTNVLSSWLIGAERLSTDHFYMHADTVFEPELLSRLGSAHRDDAVVLSVDEHECGDEEMKVITEEHMVRLISKQLKPSNVSGEFTGVLRAPGSLLPRLRKLSREVLDGPSGDRAFFEAALQHGIDQKELQVHWIDITGLRWREVDFPEDLVAAEQLLGSADAS